MNVLSSNRARTTVLLAASLVVSIALCELALRALGFEYELYPAKVEYGWPDPVALEELEVDEQFLWVPKGYDDLITALYGTKPSMVYMGDSCTAVGGYDQALKRIIAERHPEGLFRFINVGVSGWSSFQGLRQMERDIVRIGPKLVTIYFGWNDHWASFGVVDKNVASFNRRNPLSVSLSSLRLTQLFNFFHIKLYRDPGAKRRQERVSPDDFRDNLLAMVRIAREHDIMPVLVTAPTSHRRGAEPRYLATRWLNDLEDLVPLHRQYVDIVRQVARRNDVLLLDLFGLFARLPAEDVKNRYFVADGIHLTGEGSKAVGHLLYRFLEKHNLLELVVH